jgi:DNA mismatch repair protein MutL
MVNLRPFFPMEPEILLLPDAIANQIAAGEVVQRPASVVKELLENAIDAGANEVVLRVKEGGKTFIQVIDNGKGMSETDARRCFERHATSKIRTFDDMQKLGTYGFRGEALASISAVSQLELRTRKWAEETGVLIRIEGSEIKAQEPVATEKGTSFTVRNLFYNVPARRNFLKSNQVEFAHISEEFYRVALAYPQVGFSFFNGDQLILKTGPGSLTRRVSAIFGEGYRESLIQVKEETALINVSGFIGKPGISRKTRGEQYFFANNRYIRNAYLHHAVSSAFEGLLPTAHFPFYLLFLDIKPDKIDINVHPTKTEIKFEDERFVYSILQAAVRKSLQHSMLVPVLDFEPPSPWLNPQTNQHNPPREQSPVRFSSEVGKGANSSLNKPKGDSHWEKLFSTRNEDPEQRLQSFEQVQEIEKNTAITRPNRSHFSPEKPKSLNLHGQFVLYQVKSGLMVVHLARAWERIWYEQLLHQQTSGQIASQQLLFPVTLRFSDVQLALLQEIGADIRQLGLDWEPFGKNEIIVRGLPADLQHCQPAQLFQEFIEQFQNSQGNIQISRNHTIIRALAKKSSTQQEFHHWSDSELQDLINRLFSCSVPDFTPDGYSISKLIQLEEIGLWF